MSEFREPLHQPPNPVDLRRVPPSTPDCAKVRGWLRDFVDNDLEPATAKQLEEHVHRCRICAVELARAEHEVLRVRSALAKGSALPALPADFAARVVERLVLDETSILSGESLKRAAEKVAADGPAAVSGAAATGGAARRKPFAQLHPAVMLFGAMLMLWGLAFGVETFGLRSTAVEHKARMVVGYAKQAFGRGGELGPGSGLGENELLRVRRNGSADVELHDRSDGPQPAARIRVHADSEISLENGVPRIYGHFDIETNRPMSLPMADGSQLDLGVGDYAVTAILDPDADPLAAPPKDLLVHVDVKRGEATINRSGSGFPQMKVVGGQMGIYLSSSATAVEPSGGGVASVRKPQEVPRVEAPAAPAASFLLATVLDYTGEPAQGSYAWLAYSVAGMLRNQGQFAAIDGRLQIELSGKVDNGFAVVKAVAPNGRSDLGTLAPEAMRLQAQGPNELLTAPIVFDASTPFVGGVRDEYGNPLQDVRVVPCVVDELFGKVWLLPGADVTSDESGRFVCVQLPSRLPPHESLCLLLLCEGMAPATVAIPERGSGLALVEFPPITMRRLQFVGLHQLLPNAPIEVFEEIPGLPGGAAVVRRPTTSDSTGAVPALAVGWGPLWVREVAPAGGLTLRRLALDQYTGMQQFRPNGGSIAWLDQFQAVLPIPGTMAQIASSHRFADFVHSETGGTSVGRFINSVGHPVVAQVFSVEAYGERGCNVRFLGFTAVTGTLSVPLGESERNLVAIASDGSCAMALRGPASAGTTTIDVMPTGMAWLPVSLRPASGGPELVAIRFQRNAPLPGLAPEAVRFAGPSTAWGVSDLPPGQYQVRIDNVGGGLTVDVPPNGWGVIH